MNDEQNKTSSATVMVSTLIFAFIGTPIFVLAFLISFSICPDSYAMELFFPYSVILDPSLTASGGLVLILALLQFPLYGLLFGMAWSRRNTKYWLLPLCVMALTIVHIGSANIAHRRVNEMWEERFSHIK